MADIYLDLTELVSFPIRSGIQRVEGELLRCWPVELPFRIARFDAVRGMVVLPDETADCLRHLFQATEAEGDQLKAELRRIIASPAARLFDHGDETVRLVAPEVFYEPGRISYYADLPPQQMKRTHLLVFDLLPLTHPAYFGPTVREEIIGAYFRLLRMGPQLGFISNATRAAFHGRLRRSPERHGPVFYLGSDGLGPRPDFTPPPPFPVFSVVGTIEPRKSHAAILEAFRTFQRESPEARLRFYGNLGWHVSELRKTIAKEDGMRGFQFVESPSDEVIREGILESTATIYASEGEGFGLPPLESLWLGTPVVATRHVPSLELLDGKGVICLDSVDEETLVDAMRTVSRDAGGMALREEALGLNLPNWRSFAREFSRWVQG